MAYAPKPEIPGYELIEKIGQGGMGTVWKAVQKSLNRTVAIKVLASHLADDPKYLERFNREIHAAAKLTHPNIVQIFEASHIGGLHYFVMEYVEGRPLSRRLLEMGRLPEKEAFGIAQQIASALHYAWSTARLIHRDIKPDNILLTRTGQAKLTDLGLVKTAFSQEDAEMAQDGLTVGTPNYMAPEQAQGRLDVDTRADLYSLGATLFQLLTGRLPFAYQTSSRVMSAHLYEPLPDIRRINPHLSAAACSIVAKLMAKEPADRYQSGRELADDIERLLAGRTPLAQSEPGGAKQPAARRSSKPIAVALLAAACVGLIAAATFYWSSPQKPAPRPARLSPAADPDAPRRAVDAAVLYIKQHPERFSDTLEFLEDLLPQVAGTAYENALRQLISETRQRREAAAQEIFANLQARAELLTSDERFSDALAVFDSFPAELNETKAAARVAASQAAIQRAAQQRLAQLTADTLQAIKECRLEEARQTIAAIQRLQTAQTASVLNMLRAELAKAPSAPPRNGGQPNASPLQLFDQVFLPDFDRAVRSRRFAQAAALCESWLADPRHTAVEPQLRQHLFEARLLAQLLRAASEAAPALQAQTLRFGDQRGTVLKATADAVTVKTEDGMEKTFLIEDLPAETLVLLARRSETAARDPALALAAGLLLWAERNDAARAQFAEAQRLGADASVYLRRIEEVEKIQREAAAAAQIAAVKFLAERAQWSEARDKLQELLGDHADTDAVKSARGELDALAPKILQAADRADIEAREKLCRDQVAQRNGRVWTVNPAGGADFKTIAEALARARDGDGVELADGVYEEWNLKGAARDLLIFGKSGALPVVKAQRAPRDKPLFWPGDGWTFDNLCFDLRPSDSAPRPVAMQLSAPPAQHDRLNVTFRHCAFIGGGALARHDTAAALTFEDCLIGLGAQSGLPDAAELSLTMQHCTLINASPLLELAPERQTQCSVKFWDNVLMGPFAVLATPWRARDEVPPAIFYYGDYNLFLSRSVNGRLDFSDEKNLPPQAESPARQYGYEDWARLFELDRASRGFVPPKPPSEQEPPLKRFAALFVSPLEGDFRLSHEHVVRGSDNRSVGVRWAPWQWQQFQKKFRVLELK